MTFIVATKVIASRPPERRPTGTPNARANCLLPALYLFLNFLLLDQVHSVFL